MALRNRYSIQVTVTTICSCLWHSECGRRRKTSGCTLPLTGTAVEALPSYCKDSGSLNCCGAGLALPAAWICQAELQGNGQRKPWLGESPVLDSWKPSGCDLWHVGSSLRMPRGSWEENAVPDGLESLVGRYKKMPELKREGPGQRMMGPRLEMGEKQLSCPHFLIFIEDGLQRFLS